MLDAAESLMADQGYEAATVSRLVEQAGIPTSSIYHYFGSKEGVLLAVMERGARRFFEALPDVGGGGASQVEDLRALVQTVAAALERHPNFLSLLVVMATQPRTEGDGEVDIMVHRVREMALERLRAQMAITFRIDEDGQTAHELASFALAAFDGAFVSYRAHEEVTLTGALEHLPVALVAVRRDLGRNS